MATKCNSHQQNSAVFQKLYHGLSLFLYKNFDSFLVQRLFNPSSEAVSRILVQRLLVDRRVFVELLNKGHGLLPGGLPGSSGYLGREVFMAVSGRASNERRKHRYRANVSV